MTIDMDDEEEDNEIIQDEKLCERLLIVRMIGGLQSYGSMTGAMIQSILENFEDLVSKYHDSLRSKIMSQLQLGEAIDVELIKNLEEITDLKDLFVGLKTYEQQMKAMEKHFGYIQPIPIPFIPQQVLETCQYVPIIKVIEMLLSSPDVRRAIEAEQPSPEYLDLISMDSVLKIILFFKNINMQLGLNCTMMNWKS